MGLCQFTHSHSSSAVSMRSSHQPGYLSRAAGVGAKGSPNRVGPCQLSFTEVQLVWMFCHLGYLCRKWHHFHSTSFCFLSLISWESKTLEYGRQVLSISTNVLMTFSSKVTSALSLSFLMSVEMKSEVVQSCLTLWPHGLYSPRNSPGQNTGVGSLSLLQGIFPTWGSYPGLPHCRILYQLSHKGSPCL